MSPPMRCPDCDTLVDVPDHRNGKPICCPQCQKVLTAPAATTESVIPTVHLVAPTDLLPAAASTTAFREVLPVRPVAKPLSAVPPLNEPLLSVLPVRRRRFEEDEDRPRRRLRTRDLKRHKSSPVGMILVLLGAGAVMLFVLVGGFGFWLWSRDAPARASRRAMPPPLFLRPPPAVEEPVKVALVKGRFEGPVVLDPNAANPQNGEINKSYQFEAEANAVYLVEVQTGVEMALDIEGPIEVKAPPGHNFGQGLVALSFLTTKAGTCTVNLKCLVAPAGQSQLTIRIMDGTEPLPPNLKLKVPGVDLPPIVQASTYDNVFSGAAFTPDGKHFWMAQGDEKLTYWEQPGALKKGSFTIEDRLFALAVDRKGRLYAQAATGDRGPISKAKPTAGDISVWENPVPNGDNVPLPPPTRTIPLGGIVQRLINSPDGRWLYFLDAQNGKLGRIDTASATVEKVIDKLAPAVQAFCLTPDGKKIYCCSDSNRLDVIDSARFQLIQTVQLDMGQPTDVAASNEGLVFLVGKSLVDRAPLGNGLVVDLTKGLPAQARVTPLPVNHNCQFVVMLPDQRAVLFSGEHKLTACSLPPRPALFQAVTQEHFVRDFLMPGRIVLSPDGQTLLHDTGVILAVRK